MNDDATSPVFVDGTGRRSRRVRRLAYVATSACTVYMVVVGASLAAGQRTPMLELPFADPPAAAVAEVPPFLQVTPGVGAPRAGSAGRGTSRGGTAQMVDLAAFVAPAAPAAAKPAPPAVVPAPRPTTTVSTAVTTTPAVPPTIPPVTDAPTGSEGAPDPVGPAPVDPDPVDPVPATPDPVVPEPEPADPTPTEPPPPVEPTPVIEPTSPVEEPPPAVDLAPLGQVVDGLL